MLPEKEKEIEFKLTSDSRKIVGTILVYLQFWYTIKWHLSISKRYRGLVGVLLSEITTKKLKGILFTVPLESTLEFY
jgi:hypothetical protein